MRYKISIFLIAMSILFSGCASHIEYVEEPEKGIYADYIFLNNTRYIPLIKYCAYHDLDWEWDEITRTIEVRKNQTVAKFRQGSKTFIANGVSQYLERPLELHESRIYIPLDSAKYIARSVFYIEKIPVRPKGIFSIDCVVIDPGHGGKDPGAIAYDVKEKDIVLDIAKRLRKKLEDSGIRVVLTRKGDTFIPLRQRADIANVKDAKLFISIHANASRASQVRGFEVYYLSEATDDLARALEAAENAVLKFEDESIYAKSDNVKPIIWDIELSENRRQSKMLAYYICNTAARKLPLKNRGPKSARFHVLKGTRMPAVLVEVGFLTNRRELAKLKDTSYREGLSRAIANGILAYKNEFEKTDGFTY